MFYQPEDANADSNSVEDHVDETTMETKSKDD